MDTMREKIFYTCPPEVSLYGKNGWVEELRSKYFSDILEKSSQTESYQRFHGLNGGKAAELLAVLPEKAGQDRQNFAPALKDLLQITVQHPDRVFLSGYLIDGSRWDERITVDTLIYLDDFGLMAPIDDIKANEIQGKNQYQELKPVLNDNIPSVSLIHYYRLRYHEIAYPQRLKAYQQIAQVLGFEADAYPPDEIHFGHFPWLKNHWGWRIWWD